MESKSPCGQIVPASAARSLGIGGYNRNTRLDEVIPILDFFRVSFPDKEDDGGGIRGAVERKLFLPARLYQPFFSNGIDIVGERQGNDIGLKAIDDCARLLSRTAV